MSSHVETLSNLIREVDFDAVVDDVAKNFDTYDFRAQQEYARWINVDLESINFRDKASLDGFDEFVAEYSEDLVADAAIEIQYSTDVSEHGLRIWRSIMVDRDWLDNEVNTRPLGVCWSFEEEAAESHYGDFSDDMREIRVEAFVDPSDVDWATTLRLNALMAEEKEIRVKDDAFVTVLSAVWVGHRHTEDVEAMTTNIFAGTFPAGPDAFSASALQANAA
jgi:hypothetical protein